MVNKRKIIRKEHTHIMQKKIDILRSTDSMIVVVLILLSLFSSCTQQNNGTADKYGEWSSYAADKASSKYAALDQIDSVNFNQLEIAWTWRSIEEEVTKSNPNVRTWVWESTPLMVNGTLYISTSLSQVAAIDAETGETKWTYDPETWKNGTPSNNGFVHRGVSYWEDGSDKRILLGTGDGYLIALDAKDGTPVSSFGNRGRIDLTQGLGRSIERRLYGTSSAPMVCNDVIVIGSKVHDVPLARVMPPGSVRGFDIRTGKQLWLFKSIPEDGEFGNETWEDSSWKTTGSANVWAPISADDELGYVYLPFSTPSNDNYGGKRRGDGLFGESLVALDVKTGKRIWHFQLVHHGLWDYDPPAAPNLIDINVNGEPIKALAQVTKQGFVYVFNRVTGKPVWNMEESSVPQSSVPGEKSSATQPFPTKPAPFDRQGISETDVVDFTPELRKAAMKILEKYNYGPLFTPPSIEKPTIVMPGIAGGASWAGAAFDPETATLYIPSNTIPYSVKLEKSSLPNTPYIGRASALETLNGIPIWKPPYGRMTAIDMNTGEHRWMTAMGDLGQIIPALKKFGLPPVGRSSRSHLLLTKTLLLVAQEGTTQREEISKDAGAQRGVTAGAKFNVVDPKLVAYNKDTGKYIGEVALPGNATGAPMTYMLNGKQYIAMPTGGANLPPELVILRLP